jgi:hypothetical protein
MIVIAPRFVGRNCVAQRALAKLMVDLPHLADTGVQPEM